MGINRRIQWGYGLSHCSHQFSTAVDISVRELWISKDIFVYPSRFFKKPPGEHNQHPKNRIRPWLLQKQKPLRKKD